MLASDRHQSASEDGALHGADRIDGNDRLDCKIWTIHVAVGSPHCNQVEVTWSTIKLDLQGLIAVVEGDDVKFSLILILALDKRSVVAEDSRDVREMWMQYDCQILLEHR